MNEIEAIGRCSLVTSVEGLTFEPSNALANLFTDIAFIKLKAIVYNLPLDVTDEQRPNGSFSLYLSKKFLYR